MSHKQFLCWFYSDLLLLLLDRNFLLRTTRFHIYFTALFKICKQVFIKLVFVLNEENRVQFFVGPIKIFVHF